MRKIIALVCVIAVTLAMFVLPANAATNEVRLELVSKTEDTVIYNVVVETEFVLGSISAYVDVAAATTAGATVSVEKGIGGSSYNKSQYNAGMKAVVAGYLSTDTGIPAGKNVLCTITFSNVTDAFAIKKSTNSRAQFAAKTLANPETGETSQEVKSYFTQNLSATVEVAPVIAEVETETAVLTGVKEAMIEKGQAVAMEFTAAALKGFTGMNWELKFADDTTKYAVVDYPAATIQGTADDATVKFVAAFLVKSRTEAENAIETVSAGFCDETKELVAQTAAVAVTPVQ